MNKYLSLLLVITVGIFLFSCEKERGDAVACIDTGTATFTVGKTIRFMNCSKNYDATKWSVVNGADVADTLFKEPTDTLKHFSYTFVDTGVYNVNVFIWQRDSVSVSSAVKSIFVTAP